MLMPGRHWNADKYRFGFNGMEKDDEFKGVGNSYDFGARIYDPRVGRWLACDPLSDKYPNLNPYNFVGNMPIIAIDPDGKEIFLVIKEEKGKRPVITIVVTGKVVDLSDNWFVNAGSIASGFNDQDRRLTRLATDVKGINFGTKEEPKYFDKADVYFDFRFEEAKTMDDIEEEDHLVVLCEFEPFNQIASGVASDRGLTMFLDADFLDAVIHPLEQTYNPITGEGDIIFLHELITHNMGLEHTDESIWRITYGGSVNPWSQTITKGEIKTIIENTLNEELNQGRNTYMDRYGRIIPNYTLNLPPSEGGGTVNASEATVDTKNTTAKAIDKQSSDENP